MSAITSSSVINGYNVDTAMSLLSAADNGPSSCCLAIIISNIWICIKRIINLIFGDHAWYNNQTALNIIAEYCATPEKYTEASAKVKTLYEELKLRQWQGSCCSSTNLSYADQFSSEIFTSDLEEKPFYERILENFLIDCSGICFGEYHGDLEPKRFLIEYMGKFKELGVKYLFMEQFRDFEQKSLDAYFATGLVDAALRSNLVRADANFGDLGYEGVIKTARENGIRIIGIDCSDANLSCSSEANRIERMRILHNLAAQLIIDTFKEGEKFIALLGSAHISTWTKKDIPGVGDLTGARKVVIHAKEHDKVTYNNSVEEVVTNYNNHDFDLDALFRF